MLSSMQALEALSRRIDSAHQLRTVVSSMKSLASLSIRQYEQAVAALEEYSTTLEESLIILLRNQPESMTITDEKKEGRTAFLLLGSVQGMCGPFNDRIVNYALPVLRDREADPDQRDLITVGERVTGRVENEGIEPDEILSLPTSVDGITPVVQDLLTRIDQWRENRNVRTLWIIHNRMTGERSYDQKHFKLLPVDRRWFLELADREWESRSLPKFRGDWYEIFRHVMDQYLFVSLFRVYAESIASENAARLQAMGGAEENIKRRLKELEEDYNQLRQTQITEELLDLTSGYEAINRTDPGEEYRARDSS